jgi:hypothetical protein
MPNKTRHWPRIQKKEQFFNGRSSGRSKNNCRFDSCLNNYMPNNQFKKGELYSFITGLASTAIARRLQKKFNAQNLSVTIEQWSVLYHLWKKDGISQQDLCRSRL